MYTILKPFKVREELRKRNISFFTPMEFNRIFHLPNFKIKRYFNIWIKEGFIIRLKQGLYALKADLPSEEEIANRLYRPSYLSFEYALAYHNILPEMPYSITSATSKPTRHFTVGSKEYSFYTIKLKAYTGYNLITTGKKSFFMAEPAKALADYLYFVALGKKSLNERLKVKNSDREKINRYANLYDRPKLNRLIAKIL